MFDTLSERLSETLRRVAGKASLSEDNIKDTLREVRMALLEADVALPVVKEFIDQVRERAVGQEVMKSLSPGQAFLSIVQLELERVDGHRQRDARPRHAAAGGDPDGRPAGQRQDHQRGEAGALAEGEGQEGADGQRRRLPAGGDPPARDAGRERRRRLLAEPSRDSARWTSRATALQTARIQFADVLIVDTAGRLAIDAEMMAGDPRPARRGQADRDAVRGRRDDRPGRGADRAAFNEALPLTGVILTKADADARGGAALSVRAITGKPIKFLGVGEKTDALEPFHPDRMASRILGMGDVLSLIEEAERKLDHDKAEKLAKKIKKGKGFDLEDFRDQLQQMSDMGGISSMLDKLPGMGGLAQMAQQKVDTKMFVRMEAIINSMTPKERRDPDMLNGSRKRRITEGSGTSIQDLNRLLKQHKQMQKMMKKIGNKSAMQNMMRGLGGMMPPGGGFPRR